MENIIDLLAFSLVCLLCFCYVSIVIIQLKANIKDLKKEKIKNAKNKHD